MARLDAVKNVIKEHILDGDGGLFCRGGMFGDLKETVYEADGVRVLLAKYDAYFEVFGLTSEEFKELQEFYEPLKAWAQAENERIYLEKRRANGFVD